MNKISVKHFIIFIFGVTYISLKTYPSLFIAQGGRDTWLYSLIIYFHEKSALSKRIIERYIINLRSYISAIHFLYIMYI